MWKLLLHSSLQLAVGKMSVCPTCDLNIRVAPNGRLLFCQINQNAHGAFTALFDHFGSEVFPRPNWELEDQYMHVMQDPDWFKYVFYREPMVRFVSGFLATCGGNGGETCSSNGEETCSSNGGDDPCKATFGRGNVSFGEALLELPKRWVGQHERMDEHFRPQTDFCGGIGYGLAKYWGFKQQLEPATSRMRVREMLKNVGLKRPKDVIDRYFPKGGKPEHATHHTHAFEKVREYFKEAKYVGIAVNFFYKDYVTFDIGLPDWAIKDLEQLAKEGSEFAVSPHSLETLKLIARRRKLALQQEEKARNRARQGL